MVGKTKADTKANNEQPATLPQETTVIPPGAVTVLPKEVQIDFVRPVMSKDEAVANWNSYLDLKQAIITKDDKQKIGDKEFLKKSYWRKIKTFFNLSVYVVRENYRELPHGDFAFEFTHRAVAPNGAYAEGTGAYCSFEKAVWKPNLNTWHSYDKWKKEWKTADGNSYHNTRSTAETRSFNRAVSNLVGGGEVSAEEINEKNWDDDRQPETTPAADQSSAQTHAHNEPPKEAQKAAGTKEAPKNTGTLKPKTGGVAKPTKPLAELTPKLDAEGNILQFCENCEVKVDNAVYHYSFNNWEHILCRDCQPKYPRKEV